MKQKSIVRGSNFLGFISIRKLRVACDTNRIPVFLFIVRSHGMLARRAALISESDSNRFLATGRRARRQLRSSATASRQSSPTYLYYFMLRVLLRTVIQIYRFFEAYHRRSTKTKSNDNKQRNQPKHAKRKPPGLFPRVVAHVPNSTPSIRTTHAHPPARMYALHLQQYCCIFM